MHDLAIVGGGPAGYVAAERAGHLGKSVVVFEPAYLGGVCLNSGCIPTKTLLHAAKLYDHARHGAEFGVTASDVKLDFAVLKARMEKVRDTLRKGVAGLMKQAKAEVVPAAARLVGRDAGGFALVAGDREYRAANVLLATGSRPMIPPIPGLKDNPAVLTNVELLALDRLPERITVIGGGVIGLEFACFYALCGKQVTVVEMLPQVAGVLDAEAAKTLQRKLETKCVQFHLGAKVTRVEGSVVYFTGRDGAEQTVAADVVLVSTGRVPNVENLGLEALGVEFDRRGVKVDAFARTNVPGLYAAGDLTNRFALAHFASRQAMVAVHHICGRPDHCREEAIPAVIYTDPEVGTVGLSEDQAKAAGRKVKTAKMPLMASGRFLAESEEGSRGFVKVVADADNGMILGVQAVGLYASEFIAAGAVMIETELRAADAQELVFPHPTVGELLRDVMFML